MLKAFINFYRKGEQPHSSLESSYLRTGENEILPKSSSIFPAGAIQPSNKRRSKGVSSTDENYMGLIRQMYFDLSVKQNLF